jgi:hypothetical protein
VGDRGAIAVVLAGPGAVVLARGSGGCGPGLQKTKRGPVRMLLTLSSACPGPGVRQGGSLVGGGARAGRRPTNVLTDTDDGGREGEGEVRAAAAYITQAVE